MFCRLGIEDCREHPGGLIADVLGCAGQSQVKLIELIEFGRVGAENVAWPALQCISQVLQGQLGEQGIARLELRNGAVR